MKRVFSTLTLLVLLLTTKTGSAWVPNGWVYMAWPYGYSVGEETWYYFNEQDSFYVYNYCTGEVPLFGYEALSIGLLFTRWPYAYRFPDHCFYAFSETDQLRCQNLTTGTMGVFGRVDVLSRQVIDGGNDHTVAVRSDGTVWTWGHNESGQLGDGTTIDRLSPVQTLNLSHAVAVAAGDLYSIALKDDGTVWTWSSVNPYASSAITQPRPMPVSELELW